MSSIRSSFKISIKKRPRYLYTLVCFIALVLPVVANSTEKKADSNNNLITVSVGVSKTKNNHNDSNYRNESILLTKDKSLGLLARSNLSRDESIATKKKSSSAPIKLNRASRSVNYYHSFNIYNAFSYLLDDVDGDGYYQTFSVVFDADLLSDSPINTAYVYAELYLSENGGPWLNYHTTDDFLIYGDGEDDEYEVITTLHQGYKSDNYDVLIDLYEVGFENIVATYSSDDNNALYALPLESANNDIEYVVEVYDHYAGSITFYWLVILLGLRFALKPIKKIHKQSIV